MTINQWLPPGRRAPGGASLDDPAVDVKDEPARVARCGRAAPLTGGRPARAPKFVEFPPIGVMNSVIAPMPPNPADEPSRRSRDARLHELLSRHGDLMRRTIAKVCPRAMGLSVEEIEQDARVRLWSALRSERDIVHPVSYIYKVAVSATLRAIRRTKARREDPFQDDHAPLDAGHDGAPADALRIASRRLAARRGRAARMGAQDRPRDDPSGREPAARGRTPSARHDDPRDRQHRSAGASRKPAISCIADCGISASTCARKGSDSGSYARHPLR